MGRTAGPIIGASGGSVQRSIGLLVESIPSSVVITRSRNTLVYARPYPQGVYHTVIGSRWLSALACLASTLG